MAVLFDLDGTLVDTAYDLGLALNLQLTRYGKANLPHEVIRPIASHGSKGLLELGFGITAKDANFEAMKVEYLDLYESVFTKNPNFLSGIHELLDQLDEASVAWGIVTNKPRRFSVDLIKAVPMGDQNLFDRSACLYCGDDAPNPKPSPETLLMACDALKVDPTQCVYVGDAERDVQAGKAAGMKTVIALFGYLSVQDRPSEWGADFMIQSPSELLAII
jgi:2-phosphoglycolate phosphatase